MTIDEAITTAVTPIVPRCVAERYGGKDLEHCVYNYTEIPEGSGDNGARLVRYLVQLHWYFPWRPGILAAPETQRKKRALRAALLAADFTAPTVESAGDNEWSHMVFECEYVDGGD